MPRWILILMLCIAAGSAKAAETKPFTIQLTAEPASLDPTLVEDAYTLRLMHLVHTGLTAYDGAGRVHLALAEKLEPWPRGSKRSYRAFIVKGAQWSDGSAITAADFIHSLKRNLAPATASRVADLLFVLKGARAYKQGKEKDFSTVGVKAIGDRELRFELEAPCSYFEHILATLAGIPQRATGPRVYSGPYVIEEGAPAGVIRLGRNSRWAGRKSGPDRVEFLVVTEDGPSLALLRTGGLDVVVKVPALETDRLRGEGRILQLPFRATYYIAFNQRRSFWKNKEARRAVMAALDRDAILQMQRGDGERACTWMPRDLGGPEHCGPGTSALSSDPFAQASDDDLTLSFDAGSRNQLIAEKIQNDFKKKWKRDLSLQARDWKSHLQALYRGDVGIYRMGWPSLYLDAYAHLAIFRSDSPNNHTGWASAAYDKLLDRIASQPEGATRKQLIAQAAALIDAEGVAAPLFHYKLTMAVSPRAQGLKANPLGMFDFSGVK